MEKIKFDVVLSIEVKMQQMIAHLKFTNTTSGDMTLDKFTICFDGKFRNRVFIITTSRGKEISYSGPMYKRVIRPEDSLKLKVGETIQTSVVLNDAYHFEEGKKYVIQYSANNHGATIKSVRVYMEMASNKVEVLYKTES